MEKDHQAHSIIVAEDYLYYLQYYMFVLEYNK